MFGPRDFAKPMSDETSFNYLPTLTFDGLGIFEVSADISHGGMRNV